MTSEYKQRLMERQGVNREMDLDIGSSYDSYIKAFKSAEDADFADTLKAADVPGFKQELREMDEPLLKGLIKMIFGM